ncbi:hypothetical protein CPB83DRAFT_761197 [Crepidotus variabilis]|uniref:RBR-type E3 ubiquitin transferase n=1 Tax=Crepidotus variabilis TaxID=179855 RepID=A0A9P6EMP5_9AGAR|nr:hypothetical protein CPB83DRAFT_761197 [Crepidotus variabilis]
MPPVAGPSRVGSPESRVYSFDLQSLEIPLEVSRPELSPSATLVGGDEWQLALIQQLQEEEEIAAATGNQFRISHDNAWLVSVQKRRRTEQTTTTSGFTSSSVVSFDLDWQLAVQLQEAERNANTRNRPQSQNNPTTIVEPAVSSVSLPLPSPQFECGICSDSFNDDVKVSLVVCGHSYCRDCLTGFVKSKIEDSRFPIFCPECLIDRSVRNKCHVTREAMDSLNLSERELKRIEDLEILSHSVILECHRCNHRMDMPRGDYNDKTVISCTRTGCAFHWCKNCNKALGGVEERHKCKNENIERLMRRRGWKYCPGCRTPVQKESGCNHMTCGAPGCNVHFCYKCGVLIVDTTNGGDVGLTVTEHYANSKCRLFERRFLNCTIM